MVTKGIVTEIVNKYQLKVRIPIYNKAEESPTATPNDELSIGPVCTLSGVAPNFEIGDIVIIAFEQDIYTDPVILGKLYRNNIYNTYSDIHAGELKVTSKATLPTSTKIGNVSGSQIASLENIKGNIQNQIDLLSDKFSDITESSVYDVKVAGTSVVTDGVANIPYASTSQAGVVSTSAQTFSGPKTFNGITAFNSKIYLNDNGATITLENESSSTDTKLTINQDSPSGVTRDFFYLPTTNNSDTGGTYNIITTKNISDIPDASTTTRGLVSTGTQKFGGQKIFDKFLSINYSSGTGYPILYFRDEVHHPVDTTGGYSSAAVVNVTSDITQNRLAFALWSPKTDGTGYTSKSETYMLPTVDVGRTTNASYNILTSKNPVTIAQGGTGATTAADARTNLGITPANIGAATSTHNHEIQNLTNYSSRVYDATVSRTANTVLAAPSGSNGVASFRKLVVADLPTGTTSSTVSLGNHTHKYAGSSSAGGAANSAIKLDHITLNSTTINNTAGSFAFSGSGDPWSGTDWVGLQIGDNADKFQISANSNTIVFRQNDNGGTNTNWSNWVTMLTSANYTSYAASASHTHSYAGSSSAGGAATSALTATTATYPLGFSARNTNATWGNQTGTTVTSWNETDGGSIDFRKNNPSSGKLSVKVDGRFYFNEGNIPVAGLKSANGYWGMTDADGGDADWIRTTTLGLIPYQSGGSGSGHCGLGTSSWYFSYAYIDSIYTTSGAAGFKCRNISYGSGDPSGGSSGDIYIKFV